MVNLTRLEKEIEYEFGRDKFMELMGWNIQKYYRMLSGRQEFKIGEAKQIQNLFGWKDRKFKNIFFAADNA